MKKKVLIICDIFPPAFAPRMGYLCKYLKNTDWEVTVVTEYIPDNTFEFLSLKANVTAIKYYKTSGKIARHLEWLCIMLLDVLFHYKDHKMFQVCNNLIKEHHYNHILCSCYRTFPLSVAHKLSQKHGIPFTADLRDIIEQYTSDEYLTHKFHTFPFLNKWMGKAIRHKLIHERNKILPAANHITTVSPWHVKVLQTYNPNVQLIYNGFDPELFYPQRIVSERFYITYTGRVHSLSLQNPQLLFESIAKLSNDRFITPQTLRVQWFTTQPSKQLISQLAKEIGVEEYMDYYDYVPAIEIPLLLNRSSILLILTNKSDKNGPKGIMTTKFFESLAVEKPILCVRSDESYLAETIKETNAGLAATNVNEVCDFIQFHYNEWKEKGYTTSSVKKDKLNLFSRKEQAKQFIQIFEKVQTHG